MKKGSKFIAASTRSRKLLVRLDDWVAACRRLAEKSSTKAHKDNSSTSHLESVMVMSITEVVSEAFRVWSSPGSRLKASSEKINYLERVLEELQVVTHALDGRDTAGLGTGLHSVLLQLNFNARPYCLSYIAQIIDRVRTKDTFEQKVDVLDEYLKTIAQLYCEHGMTFYDLYPSVKEFIGGWLIEEIAYLERKASRYNEQPQPSGEHFDNGMPMKVLLDTSVARLACVTRALVERGIIQNSNVSDLSQLLTKLVITRRSENVSARAFRLRYYDIEDSTRDSVVKTLRELARHIEMMGK